MLGHRLGISGVVLAVLIGLVLLATPVYAQGLPTPILQEYAVPTGDGPHDVWPAADGGVWYTAQRSGMLGWLDPASGSVRRVSLGVRSAPHGVIVGPDGAPWVTDGGLNAIVRVDPGTFEVQSFALPGRGINLNTATFDTSGTLWFTGQEGYFGRLDLRSAVVHQFEAPRGAGPYGMTTTPLGQVFYASLAGSYIGQINLEISAAELIDPPTPRQGARRLWSDSLGMVWVSEWNAGQLARFDPSTGQWREWRLSGNRPTPYAVYVDESNVVWLSDWTTNALVRFDPRTESFTTIPFVSDGALVRQIAGRPGEVWGAMSGRDRLVVARTR